MLLRVLCLVTVVACVRSHEWVGGPQGKSSIPSSATVHVLDSRFEQLVSASTKPEVLANGFKWAEGSPSG